MASVLESSQITEESCWFYQTWFYYFLWQSPFGFQLWGALYCMLISIKCRHSKVSSIECYSHSARSVPSDGAGTPMSSRTAGPLIPADPFQVSAFQQAISARFCEHFPAYVQLNAHPIIYEELPHRHLSPFQLPLIRYAAPQISTVHSLGL